MFEYSIQLSWPSTYEKGAFGWIVEKFESFLLLDKKKIVERIKNEKIKEEIKSNLYLSKTQPKDSKFPFQSNLACETSENNCVLMITEY